MKLGVVMNRKKKEFSERPIPKRAASFIVRRWGETGGWRSRLTCFSAHFAKQIHLFVCVCPIPVWLVNHRLLSSNESRGSDADPIAWLAFFSLSPCRLCYYSDFYVGSLFLVFLRARTHQSRQPPSLLKRLQRQQLFFFENILRCGRWNCAGSAFYSRHQSLELFGMEMGVATCFYGTSQIGRSKTKSYLYYMECLCKVRSLSETDEFPVRPYTRLLSPILGYDA